VRNLTPFVKLRNPANKRFLGMIALRKGHSKVTHEHFVDAIAEVQAKKKDT